MGLFPQVSLSREFAKLEKSEDARKQAYLYMNPCQNAVEPSRADTRDAAKDYFVLRRMVEQEEADALRVRATRIPAAAART